ncbi:hypothetical protein PL75_09165 [Neisseria arctica]|uniref:Uncharacterized protein n=1 Tax=Neisseria arctica TaxID=1470200 RepID=A0A0J0YQ17_9NEIS|nr:hypothetical protein [Neisseria arctica]KLT72241.1 hypothetical protein PL75_09165 [Neisseria arctica]UOO87545.1 hypothetical protein LVJ86_04675 [Neisseria arctica]
MNGINKISQSELEKFKNEMFDTYSNKFPEDKKPTIDEFAKNAASIIYQRVIDNAANKRYLEYGLYWFALKEAISAIDSDLFIGEETDSVIRDAYRHESHVDTIMAAEYYAMTQVRLNYIQPNREFNLDSETTYSLFDEDLEILSVIS